jgi:hypothetical protein
MITLHFAVANPDKKEFVINKYQLDPKLVDLLDACDSTPNSSYLDYLCRQVDFIRLPQDTKIIRDSLAKFDKIKNKPLFKDSKNIDSYKKINDLYKVLDTYKESEISKPTEQQKREKKTQATIIYQDREITWYKCIRPEDVVTMGSGTHWCTTQRSFATEYLAQGPVYIAYGGPDAEAYEGKPIYQFHLGKEMQYMNPADESAGDIKFMFIAPDSSGLGYLKILKRIEKLPIDIGQVDYFDSDDDQWVFMERVQRLLPKNPLMILDYYQEYLDWEQDESTFGRLEFNKKIFDKLIDRIEETHDSEAALELMAVFVGKPGRQLTRLLNFIHSDPMTAVKYYVRIPEEREVDMEANPERVDPLTKFAVNYVNDWVAKADEIESVNEDFATCLEYLGIVVREDDIPPKSTKVDPKEGWSLEEMEAMESNPEWLRNEQLRTLGVVDPIKAQVMTDWCDYN